MKVEILSMYYKLCSVMTDTRVLSVVSRAEAGCLFTTISFSQMCEFGNLLSSKEF